jgi:hypothetical protein
MIVEAQLTIWDAHLPAALHATARAIFRSKDPAGALTVMYWSDYWVEYWGKKLIWKPTLRLFEDWPRRRQFH